MSERFGDDVENTRLPEVLSYDEGLREVVDRIDELLLSQDLVVVAIEGSAPNVGKSSLSGTLVNGYIGRNISAHYMSDVSTFSLDIELQQIARDIRRLGSPKALLIFEGMGIDVALPVEKIVMVRRGLNDKVARMFAGSLFPQGKLDLMVSLSSPDQPFRIVGNADPATARPVGDVVICNELARRK